MSIPVSYNLRNLAVRKTTTIMTVIGIAITVAVLVADLALVNGLTSAFRASGSPLNILVLSKGSKAEVTSQVSRQALHDIQAFPGIARSASDRPLVSGEVVTALTLPTTGAAVEINVTVRGLAETGIEMRGFSTVQGRWFQPGRRELVVGRFIAEQYAHTRVGNHVRFGKGEWEVVGVLDGRGTAVDSEVWGDLNQISADFDRPTYLSSVLIRASDAAFIPALINSLGEDRRLNISGVPEPDYYASQMIAGVPVQYLGMFVAVVMAIGSGFAAMNTMFAAVARRVREIGTLRVLGFSTTQIMLSFLTESLIISAAAGLLGCLIVLPLNNFRTGLANLVTFSHIAFEFRIGAFCLFAGLAFAICIGLIGGLIPARLAARTEVFEALRST